MSTKIFEYAAMRVPTISLNYGGDIDRLVNDHSLGYSCDLNHQDIDQLVINLANRQLDDKFSFRVEPFSYENLAAKYSDLIESL